MDTIQRRELFSANYEEYRALEEPFRSSKSRKTGYKETGWWVGNHPQARVISLNLPFAPATNRKATTR